MELSKRDKEVHVRKVSAVEDAVSLDRLMERLEDIDKEMELKLKEKNNELAAVKAELEIKKDELNRNKRQSAQLIEANLQRATENAGKIADLNAELEKCKSEMSDKDEAMKMLEEATANLLHQYKQKMLLLEESLKAKEMEFEKRQDTSRKNASNNIKYDTNYRRNDDNGYADDRRYEGRVGEKRERSNEHQTGTNRGRSDGARQGTFNAASNPTKKSSRRTYIQSRK